MNEAAFTPHTVSTVLSRHAPAKHYVIAFSGGMDSHVLLHVMSRLAAEQAVAVSAVHIHHGLHERADDWTEHCRRICAALDVPLDIIHVEAKPAKGESPEDRARQARYAALAERQQPGQVLLTAHHLDDQAETFMLQLLRGSGLRGVSAMPVVQPFAQGLLLRPLLEVSRETLAAYAAEHKLEWIEDSSNSEMAYDRNYLRHHVMPLLFKRWPAARQTIARAASHAAETVAMAETLARQDLIKARVISGNALCVPVLLALSPERRRNLLRIWIRDQDFPVPSARRLESITTDMLQAAPDRKPLVRWNQAEVRRYRDRLYLLPALPESSSAQQIIWRAGESPQLPLGCLQEYARTGHGVREAALHEHQIEIRFRQYGETIRPAGSGRRRSLKKLFQENAIPPWLRDLLPLIYLGDTLAAVPGICVAREWAAGDSERGIEFYWRLPPSLAEVLPGIESTGREKH